MDHHGENTKANRASWLCRLPLLVAALLICLITGFNLVRLVRAQAPRNPWESLEVVEAWRSARGLPVYDASPQGHATHMYGAFVPWVQGVVFHCLGPNNVSGRVLSLISALATVTLLALVSRGAGSAWYMAVAWAAVLGVNHRSGQYFAENRPDMPALFFATAAVILLAAGQERRRGLYVVLGSACLVVGFFFKQTAAVCAVVPLVWLILRWRRPAAWQVVFALCPVAIMTAVTVGLKYVNPAVHHYMIEVPGGYAIDWARFVKFTWEMLLDSPLFLVLFADWLFRVEDSPRPDPRTLWLLAVLAVTIPWSALSRAKVGGWPNSQLPALFAIMAYCVLRMPRLLKRLERPGSPLLHRFLVGSFMAVLMMMTIFPHLTYANNLLVPVAQWDEGYWKAVSLARKLPGRVVCPEDPTIPLYAKQFAGQNFFSEKDAHPQNGRWPEAMPERVLADIEQADYVFDVTNYWGENIDAELLSDLGFEPMAGVPLDPECYKIWRRKGAERYAGTGTHQAGSAEKTKF